MICCYFNFIICLKLSFRIYLSMLISVSDYPTHMQQFINVNICYICFMQLGFFLYYSYFYMIVIDHDYDHCDDY